MVVRTSVSLEVERSLFCACIGRSSYKAVTTAQIAKYLSYRDPASVTTVPECNYLG